MHVKRVDGASWAQHSMFYVHSLKQKMLTVQLNLDVMYSSAFSEILKWLTYALHDNILLHVLPKPVIVLYMRALILYWEMKNQDGLTEYWVHNK